MGLHAHGTYLELEDTACRVPRRINCQFAISASHGPLS